MAKTTDALKIIEKINRTDPQLQEMIAEASINAHVAQLIYEARIKAGLTQQQLADLIGTKQERDRAAGRCGNVRTLPFNAPENCSCFESKTRNLSYFNSVIATFIN
jgi:hypothetical protein